MRILIIDAPPVLRDQCTAHIASHWPGAAVDTRDGLIAAPAKTRAGDGGSEWQQYDALLLNHHTEGQTGIEWLRACKERSDALPPHLRGYQTVVDRLLAKNPDDRFQSARELFAYIAY